MIITEQKTTEIGDSEVHTFDGYYMFLRGDGIIQIQFQAGFYGELEDAKNIVKIFQKISPNKKCLVLAVYEEDNMFSKEVRDFIASKEVSEIVKADAFVIKGLALRIFGNVYLRINKPNRPGKLFNNKTEAVEWLKQIDKAVK